VRHHDDLAIVRALDAGDARRFDQFFDEIFPRLFRFVLARTRGDTELARDVCQQTLVRAIENLHRYRGEAALFTWICQIARNALCDLAERAQRERANVLAWDASADVRAAVECVRAPAQLEPEQRGASAELAQLVLTALDSLPVHYSRVLEWKYVDGLSVQDMSQRLGHPFPATQSLLWRARASFREVFVSLAGAEAAALLHD
jgi:RNA polymerase sigma-70 factor, ECF subfamily